jgi:hypothetical protein
VEHHPLDGDRRLEGLQQVPGDGLALAVLIGGEVELVGLLQGRLQLRDLLALVRRYDVERLEAVVDVDPVPGLGQPLVRRGDLVCVARQVADVTDRRLHGVARAEVAHDGLGGRLDDDKALAGGHVSPS